MWLKSREHFQCSNEGFSISNGNVTKFSVDIGFSYFLISAVKYYKLDMNFKDKADGKTILDFLSSEIERYENTSVDNRIKVKEYQRIYELLKINGAKHSWELNK